MFQNEYLRMITIWYFISYKSLFFYLWQLN